MDTRRGTNMSTYWEKFVSYKLMSNSTIYKVYEMKKYPLVLRTKLTKQLHPETSLNSKFCDFAYS